MAISTTCPSCDAAFRLADELAGKRVRCQRCKTSFVVPEAGDEEPAPGTRVKSGTPPGKKTPPPPKPAARDDDENDDDRDERPRKKRNDDDDEDRTRDDDEDDDRSERPRRTEKRKRKSKKASGATTILLVLLGVGLVSCLGCVGVGGIVYALSDGGGPGQQNVAAIPVAFGPDGAFRTNNTLNRTDRRKEDRRYKVYSVPMELGRTYVIEMTSQVIDPYLFVLDDNNQVMAQDDDNGGNLNARIVFTPRRAGTYQIEATTFDEEERGPYTLTIRRN